MQGIQDTKYGIRDTGYRILFPHDKNIKYSHDTYLFLDMIKREEICTILYLHDICFSRYYILTILYFHDTIFPQYEVFPCEGTRGREGIRLAHPCEGTRAREGIRRRDTRILLLFFLLTFCTKVMVFFLSVETKQKVRIVRKKATCWNFASLLLVLKSLFYFFF